MINHFRCLLLNEPPDLLARHEQYVPRDFRGLPLPADAAAVRSALIDQKWPREYRNFVATLLSNLVMASPFAQWINKLDDRTTLDPLANAVSSLQNRVTVDRVSAASSVTATGIFVSRPALGLFSGAWQLQKIDDTHVSILNLQDASSLAVSVSFTGDTTTPQLIDPENTLSFQLVGVSTVPTGLSAIIRADNSMTYDTMTALTKLRSDGVATDIFRQKEDVSLMNMLADAFHNSQRPDFAMAAILAAYFYRLKGVL